MHCAALFTYKVVHYTLCENEATNIKTFPDGSKIINERILDTATQIIKIWDRKYFITVHSSSLAQHASFVYRVVPLLSKKFANKFSTASIVSSF